MDARAAKREACWRAASVIRTSLEQGWPDDDLYPDADERTRVAAALNDVVAELDRRGHR
ncbi:hypothetical protein [Micromonospora rubida]|uniref:hypothetical protein n=1 Tax=Micromonospora rubida TaxID=2697657 RepID=UPI00137832D9|nr:hypothetical protein [Micromonospora rubida]NBE80333.1 hypothetical protein [Micromonospora rubida]